MTFPDQWFGIPAGDLHHLHQVTVKTVSGSARLRTWGGSLLTTTAAAALPHDAPATRLRDADHVPKDTHTHTQTPTPTSAFYIRDDFPLSHPHCLTVWLTPESQLFVWFCCFFDFCVWFFFFYLCQLKQPRVCSKVADSRTMAQTITHTSCLVTDTAAQNNRSVSKPSADEGWCSATFWLVQPPPPHRQGFWGQCEHTTFPFGPTGHVSCCLLLL